MRTRAELLVGMNDIITQGFDYLILMNPLIQGKVVLLLGYYLPHIMKSQEDIQKALEFILKCFIKSNDEVTLSHIAQESMQNILKNKEMIEILIPLINDFVQTIVNFSQQVTSSPFFEFVGDFIIKFKKHLGNNIISLLQCMVSRVIVEM